MNMLCKKHLFSVLESVISVTASGDQPKKLQPDDLIYIFDQFETKKSTSTDNNTSIKPLANVNITSLQQFFVDYELKNILQNEMHARQLIGCIFHISTGRYDETVFRRSVEFSRRLFDIVKKSEYGFDFTVLNIGGDFPIVD